MGLHVPRSTAYIQEHVILTAEHTVEYTNGTVNWRLKNIADEGLDNDNGKEAEAADSTKAGPDGDGNGEDASNRRSGAFKEDEVVFICYESELAEPPRESEPSSEPPLGTSAPALALVPASQQHVAVYLVRENPGNPDEPFRLWVVSCPAGLLDQGLLDRHLLDKAPAHLLGDSEDDNLHVIVSTKSGMGLAQAVFGSVLQKLLAVLGLHPRPHDDDDFTPPESPGLGTLEGKPKAGVGRLYGLFVTKSQLSIREFARRRWGAGSQEESELTPAASKPGRSTKTISKNSFIILLSGDGGIVDLLNGAGEPTVDRDDHDLSLEQQGQPTIALLPLGTGNALFHSLHRPLYQRQGTASASAAASGPSGPSHLVIGLRTLFRGVAAPLPTFRASFSPGSTLAPHPEAPPPEQQQQQADDAAGENSGDNTSQGTGAAAKGEPVDSLLGAIVASYGFHAQLVWESDTPAYRRHGDKRFGMAARELLTIDHSYDAAVEVVRPGDKKEGKEASRTLLGQDGEKFTYVLATMVSNLERTFTISPASRPLDARLRLVSFGAVGAERTMEIMRRAYDDGAHVRMEEDDDKAGSEQGGQDEKPEKKKKVVGYDEIGEVKVIVRERDPRWRKVCVDGTIVELPQDGWMTVRKMEQPRLRVLVDGAAFQ